MHTARTRPPHPGLLAHHPEAWAGLRRPSDHEPLRILGSGCLGGWSCGVDGSDYGHGSLLPRLRAHPALAWTWACPEDVAMGTPRPTPDLHAGDGMDLLDGHARLLDEHGRNWTDELVESTAALTAMALDKGIELAVLIDASGLCGSQVIHDGNRFESSRYRQGVGLFAATLLRAGVPVIAQRDHASLERLLAHCDPEHAIDRSAEDHHDHPWCRQAFGTPT